MNTITAHAPGHVTGIFYIDDLADDPLHRGSLGAGFSIDRGVTTRISILEDGPGEPVFSIGDNRVNKLPVSSKLYHHFIESLTEIPPQRLQIDHIIEVPQGSGFGTSGAGALSLAFALNRFFGNPFTDEKAASFAHLTEIECRTGLGTVIGEFYGGFEIRTKPGAPGIGSITPIPFSPGIKAVFAVRGPYSTSAALNDVNIRDRINRAGQGALAELEKNPTTTKFQKLSRQFASGTGLFTPWVESVLNFLEKKGIVGSMLMFGEAVFTLVEENSEVDVKGLLRSHTDNSRDKADITIFSTSINTTGGTYRS